MLNTYSFHFAIKVQTKKEHGKMFDKFAKQVPFLEEHIIKDCHHYMQVDSLITSGLEAQIILALTTLRKRWLKDKDYPRTDNTLKL